MNNSQKSATFRDCIQLSSEGELTDSDVDEQPYVPAKIARTNETNFRKRKRINSVWKSVVEENALDEAFSKADVKSSLSVPVIRDVESYTFEESDLRDSDKSDGFPNGDDTERSLKRPLSERLSDRIFDASISRDHYKVDFDSSVNDVITAITRVLEEPRQDMIEKVVDTLGVKRALEFSYITEDLERKGGLPIADGSRRRTPGGVYLLLIRRSTTVTKEEKKIIFKDDKIDKILKKRRLRRDRLKRRFEEIEAPANKDEESDNSIPSPPNVDIDYPPSN